MRWGVVRFPGSLDDRDTEYALEQVLGERVVVLWHKERELHGVDCVILPGGFSHGDYLRAGALARFAPVMESLVHFAHDGGLVMGLCNGFQVLCEAGLLPGGLIRNTSMNFVCCPVNVRVEQTETPFTRECTPREILTLPIKHGAGCFVADRRVLEELEHEQQVVLRYVDAKGRTTGTANPNGSLNSIAGIVNRRRNVLGMMPHPEHACEEILGSEDGQRIFRSIATAIAGRQPGSAAWASPGR